MRYISLIIMISVMFVVSCGTDTSFVRNPSCTVTKANGAATITCPDGSQASINDGEVGVEGPVGPMGIGCSVAQTTTGATITCGTSVAIVTNGIDGVSIQGPSGQDGSSCSASQTATGSIITCDNGTSSVISNGSIGANGLTSLISSNSADLSLCDTGGTIFSMGLDVNNDNVLENSEILNVAVICNGEIGAAGQNAPPTAFSPVKLILPCAQDPMNPTTSELNNPNYEVFIQLSNGLILTSFSANEAGLDTHFSVLPYGTWQSTGSNGLNCTFTYNTDGTFTRN